MDIRDISSIVSDEKGSNMINVTEECMIDNTYKI